MKRGWILIAIVGLLLVLAISAQSQENSKIERIFGESDSASVIVVLKDDNSMLKRSKSVDSFSARKAMIQRQQENVLSELNVKRKDGTVRTEKDSSTESDSESNEIQPESTEDYDFELENEFTTVNGFSGILKKEAYEKLMNDPRVLDIYNPRKIKAHLDSSASIVNATRTWGLLYGGSNITGKGQSVCVIDTGIDYTHSALGSCNSGQMTSGTCSKVISGYDFSNGDNDPIDDNGHGSHVAGIISSTDSTYRGVAPDSTLIAMKILDDSGEGFTDDLISAIDWCVYNHSIFNISVISMSLGADGYKNTTYCDTSDDPLLVAAIHNAIARNISVVASSGNNGHSSLGVSTPACISNVTVVGSTDKSNGISSFSDLWGLPMLLAPGSLIASVSAGGGFVTSSGTSMAAPHISGVFALMRQYKKAEQNRVLTQFELQNASNATGKLITDSGIVFSRINVYQAILSMDSNAPNITFVFPTPSNNSNVTNIWFFLNITSNEGLSTAILEFNSSNSTMNMTSPQNWQINKSSSFGRYSYRVYANDTFGNMQISQNFTITLNNSAPNVTSYSPNQLNVSTIEPNNLTFSINVSDQNNDNISVSWYQNGSLSFIGNGSTIVTFNFTFLGNFTSSGNYNITAIVSDNQGSTLQYWNLTVNNTNLAPSITSVNLTNTDYLNRTNGTLQAYWSFSDVDNNTITINETLWYNGSILFANLTNKTFIHPANTTKNQNWTFSVRVFDGANWSNFANSSLTVIRNSQSSLNLTSTILNISETQLANITLNSSDLDDDFVNYSINDSNFIRFGKHFIWTTNLSSSGTYSLNISAFDQQSNDSITVTLNVEDVRDLDNDGNPDFNETDDDNDGILDQNDFTVGNVSSINTTVNLSLAINGTTNLSKLFNGTFLVNLSNGTATFLEFNFTFNSTNVLDFGNITINRSSSGRGAISIKGNLNLFNTTKVAYIDRLNTTSNAVCIKDASSDFDSISTSCNGASETLLSCSNATSGQYSCNYDGSRLIVAGLNHSAVREQCTDSDGDLYGDGCTAGSDCNDNDASKTTSCSSGSGGGGGGGGGSGGGGGGGGGALFICNREWQCSDYRDCTNGFKVRTCDLTKVPQRSQPKECDTESNMPGLSLKCEMPKVEAIPQASCSDGILNQDEEQADCGGVCNPCVVQEEVVQPAEIKKEETTVDRQLYLYLAITLFVATIGFFVYYRKPKQPIKHK